MAEVQKATLVLDGDSSRLRRAAGRARDAMGKAGRRIRRTAGRIGKLVTAAFAAAGGAAVKFAADFEREMTKVNTLVGLSRERVGRLSNEILNMATSVGRAPTELARGLFRLTSGGERGANVMESLRTAAKAAAVGMGEVGNLTRIATSAAQAFSGESASVSDVLNTMVKVVREGNVQVNRLQSSLGQVQATAADAGLTFQDIGGFLATASRVMGDTQKAARGLRQFLARLAKPTQEQIKAFRQAGTSVEEFRRSIRTEGLARPLVELVRSARDSGVEIANMAGSVRAMTPILATAGSQAEKYLKINRRVADFQGTVDEAFRETGRTLSFMIDQIKTAAQVGLTRIGREFFPELKDFARFLRNNMGTIFATVIRGVRDMAQAMVIAGVKIADSPIGKLMGLEVPEGPARILAQIERVEDRIERLAAKAETALSAAESGAGRMAEDAFFRLLDQIQASREELQGLEDELGGGIFGRMTDLADRLENGIGGVGSAANDARDPVQALKDDVNQLGQEIVGLIPRISGVMSAASGGGGGGGAPRLPDASGLRNVGRGPAQIIRGAGFDPSALEGFMRRSGEDAGKDFSEGMEETLKRGARRAMESLLRGLFEGRDSILDAVANIGLSIGSALATDGIMSALDIGSPSRVARNIGEQVGLGLIQGMRSMEKATVRAGRSLARSAAVGGASVAGAGAGGGSVVQSARSAGAAGGGTIRNKVELTIQAMDAKDVRRLVEENPETFAAPAIRAMNESLAARNAAFGG